MFHERRIRCIEVQACISPRDQKFTQLVGGDIAGHRHYNYVGATFSETLSECPGPSGTNVIESTSQCSDSAWNNL
jgi:hypothetical protein